MTTWAFSPRGGSHGAQQAEKIVADASGELSRDSRRRDLRGELCVTVGPTDARDFDDAIGARCLSGGGFKASVHIADDNHRGPLASPSLLTRKRRRTREELVRRRLTPRSTEIIRRGRPS